MITIQITGANEAIERIFTTIPENVIKNIKTAVINNTAQMAVNAQSNVNGPRPEYLEQVTGSLYQSLVDNVAFNFDDYEISGQTGSDVTSDKGFPYAAYWEGAVDQGAGTHSPWPRPFLKPALNSVSDKFISDVQDAVSGAIKS